MALGGTLLLIQRLKNDPRMDHRIAITLAPPSSSTETGELLPNHATPTEESEVAKETPEQVLGELERQDF
jgi:hypothetical protein